MQGQLTSFALMILTNPLNMTVYNMLAVGLGGFLGSILRFVAVKTIDEYLQRNFFFGTLSVNILGSFILGVLVGIGLKRADLSEQARLFIGVGFCGGFTTFSAFALENVDLLNGKHLGTLALYISVSVAAGILAMFAGIWIGRSY
jgi:CrcB protein